jgi:hypothetical protein
MQSGPRVDLRSPIIKMIYTTSWLIPRAESFPVFDSGYGAEGWIRTCMVSKEGDEFATKARLEETIEEWMIKMYGRCLLVGIKPHEVHLKISVQGNETLVGAIYVYGDRVTIFGWKARLSSSHNYFYV